ncbi:cyclic nucleotide-gated cation channel beta-1-like [Helianthus annuus]|uniref:cyclic nucleotide-gated cation channel beta-1-like n=1 Tax=Helianthus annuus TaxID=4232 RepID=UPI000B8FE173|nr:cyclic nucleotide-gated cation channel beta-1-like [Helianthus annuus]
MVDELKETAGKDDGEGEQKDEKKKEEETGGEKQEKVDEKLEKKDGKAVTKKQQVNNEDQKQTAKEAEVPENDKDSERNKIGIVSEYHQVPPPFEKKFTFYDDDKVEKAFNMVDQLLDNIDVSYSKSDDTGDSEVVGKVVEHVLQDNSTKTDKSESHDENEGSFHESYLKNLKSKKIANDDPVGLAFTM